MTTKAGFVGFGFYGYPKEYVENRASEANKAVQELGIETTYADPVITSEDVERAVRQLKADDFTFLIACVTTWTESPNVVGVLREFFHKPILLWGLGGRTEEGKLISPAGQAGTTALREPLEAMGAKFKFIYDRPDAPMNLEAVKGFAAVAETIDRLSHSRIGLLGYADMGLYTTMFDGLSLRSKIGPEVESFDMLEITQRMEKLDEKAVSALVAEMKENWAFEQPIRDEALNTLAGMYLAVKEKVAERNYVAFSPKCVYGVSRYMGITPCLVLSKLADEIDCVCECDVLGLVTQVMERFLTGQATTFMEHYEFMEDRLLVGVCGYAPLSFVEGPVTVRGHGWGGFTGMVLTSQLKEGRLTLARLSSRGDRYRLHIATGQGVRPRQWEELGWTPPAPRFPAFEVILDGSVEDFAQNVCGQHYAVVYGDHSEKLTELCRLLGVEVIRT